MSTYTQVAPVHTPKPMKVANLIIATRTNGQITIVAPSPSNPWRPPTGQMYPR